MTTLQETKGILAHAPVKLVVAQVRFERHVDVAEASFVTRLSKLVGDEFSTIEQANVRQITASPAGMVTVTDSAEGGWTLSSKDAKIVVLESSAALEVTRYVDWGEFRAQLERLLRTVEELVQPATEQRVGLRYIDELDSEEGVHSSWKGFVRDSLLGPVLHPDMGSAITSIEQRIVFSYDGGATCLLRHGYTTEPPLNGRYIIDTDVFREVKGAYDGDSISRAYDSFHAKADEVFLGCLTPEYIEQLRTGE
jgi:uncharacterized protein (TIGR04255 family)